MKNLLLVNPVTPRKVGLTINVSSRFPPLGLGIVAALTPDNWHVKIIDENFEEFTYTPTDILLHTDIYRNLPIHPLFYSKWSLYRKFMKFGGVHAVLPLLCGL